MTNFNSCIVVDPHDLQPFGLSYDSIEALMEHYEVSNDTYHRYYPGDSWTYIKDEVKQEVNAALIAAGVPMPDVLERDVYHPEGYFQFYVLLHFSW